MLKIFLVEDETVIRDGLREKIPWEEYGYRFVGDAADGELALPMIRKSKPDVLITDIKMPFMDGLSLSRIVHTEFPAMKIIIISGYDDFEYARQAIEVGVEQYLLKPITKLTLKKTLMELKDKIAQEMQQNDYQLKYRNEMTEYEQFSRNRFFERLLSGKLSVQQMYDEAAKQPFELDAPCYNLILFSIQDQTIKHTEPEYYHNRQEDIVHYFLRHPQYILFRCNINTYGVLVKGEVNQIQSFTNQAVDQMKRICTTLEDDLSWYAAIGEPVERLSLLPECYQGVNHSYSYRFILPKMHILSRETLHDELMTNEESTINSVDSRNMDPEIIRDFLTRGSRMEISDFVTNYLKSIQEALMSRMFRNYVILNIRFAVIAYLESMGVKKENYLPEIEQYGEDMNISSEEVSAYFIGMLETALTFRDRESDDQGRKILRKAVEYINQNYTKDTLSLNSVAKEVEVSANYLSAVFSQSMQKTFIEYVTGKRMEYAKRLLRSTDRSSGEIAAETGYKDPHYFSFVFKKTQGCSPREYRIGKKSVT